MSQKLVGYKPVERRKPDLQYNRLLKSIMSRGYPETTVLQAKVKGGEPKQTQDAGARFVVSERLKFSLSNGFPLITERDLLAPCGDKPSIFHQALGELFGFLNGAHTQEELDKYGCFWWKRFVTEKKCAKRGLETGDLGPGSYGPAWCAFPTAEGAPFDQIAHVVQQIKELPNLRTHFVSPWIPQYIARGEGKQQKVVVAPCHGWLHFLVTGNKLILNMIQRSGDVPVGVTANIVQYAALTMMMAHVTGLQAWEYYHTISHAHVYDVQIPSVVNLVSREPRPFPTVTLVDPPDNLRDFRQEHFRVEDYYPHEAMTVPTPV